MPGYEAQIIGPDDVEVPTGEPGRLRVRGGSIASEYFGDAEKTAETYVGGWCVSADIFRAHHVNPYTDSAVAFIDALQAQFDARR